MGGHVESNNFRHLLKSSRKGSMLPARAAAHLECQSVVAFIGITHRTPHRNLMPPQPQARKGEMDQGITCSSRSGSCFESGLEFCPGTRVPVSIVQIELLSLFAAVAMEMWHLFCIAMSNGARRCGSKTLRHIWKKKKKKWNGPKKGTNRLSDFGIN